VPFVFEGVIRFDQFRNMLEHCNTGGRCQKLCKEYQVQLLMDAPRKGSDGVLGTPAAMLLV
jgi:hypothetical protein